MKTIRTIINNKFFGAFMSFLILFATTYKGNAATLDLGISEEISGQQMFKEIFFFDNGFTPKNIPAPLEAKIEVMKSFTTEQKAERSKMINDVVKIISENSPRFFSKLENNVKSKNPYMVQSSLKEGANLILGALNLKEDYEKVKASLKGEKVDLTNNAEVEKLTSQFKNSAKTSQIDEAACVAFAVVVVVVLALAAAAAVAWIVFLVEVIDHAHLESESGRGSLLMDQYVNTIITNYN